MTNDMTDKNKDMDIMFNKKLRNESSMSYWWPKIKDLDIPQPRTISVPLDTTNIVDVLDGKASIMNEDKMIQACKDIGTPCFIRNNIMSAKHSWKDSCYVTDIGKVMQHVFHIAEHTLMAEWTGELRITTMFFREFLELETTGFTAFHGNMPINKERRCFINGGVCLSMYPYWFEDVFKREINNQDRIIKTIGKKKAAKAGYTQIPSDWQKRLNKNNVLTHEDRTEIMAHLAKVSAVFPKGYWSVDFTKGKDGKWYLIDMARGELSQHHPDCKHIPSHHKDRRRKDRSVV